MPKALLGPQNDGGLAFPLQHSTPEREIASLPGEGWLSSCREPTTALIPSPRVSPASARQSRGEVWRAGTTLFPAFPLQRRRRFTKEKRPAAQCTLTINLTAPICTRGSQSLPRPEASAPATPRPRPANAAVGGGQEPPNREAASRSDALCGRAGLRKGLQGAKPGLLLAPQDPCPGGPTAGSPCLPAAAQTHTRHDRASSLQGQPPNAHPAAASLRSPRRA